MPTACFTGHRKLGEVYYNSFNPSTEWLTLHEYVGVVVQGLIVNSNVDHFISGLAIGVDMLGAECVANARTLLNRPDVRLTGAMPFPSQASRWPQPTRDHWAHVCSLCNETVAVSQDPYHPSKMQIRNEWMVANSHYVIAVWNGMKKGGTWNCIEYAKAQNRHIFCVQPIGLQWQGAWIGG